MRPKKRNYPGYPYRGVSALMGSMQSQCQSVPMAAAAPFANSPDSQMKLSSAPPSAPQEAVGTPWQHVNLVPTITQPPPWGHADAGAIPTATAEFYPYPSPPPSHNPSWVPGFPTFSHGSGQPWSFNFQSIDIPLLLDQYPFFYQQETMQLPGYDTTDQNPENSVDHTGGATASAHDGLEGVYHSDAASTAHILNSPFSLPGPSIMSAANMETNYRLSIDLPASIHDEPEWQLVEKAWSDDDQVSPGPPRSSSSSASPIDGPWQCIPSYLDQSQEVFSSHTAYGTSSPDAVSYSSHEDSTNLRRPRKRGALSPTARQQTSKTRRMAACVRCQMQRKRCTPDPDNEMGPCLTCLKVLPSKKVIHKLDCCRWKLTAATVYRQAHLQLTKRWRGSTMYDIPSSDWVDDEIRIIQISEGLCSKPFEIKVRRFKPKTGDVTDRIWIDKHGNPHVVKLPPYAIASVSETCKRFVKHAEENAFEAVEQFANRHDVHPIVQETYKAAWNHMRHVTGIYDNIDLKEFMKEFWGFWFVLRHTMGSNEMVGDEHLGMEPETHKDYPFPPGHLSVPRMVCQQFDSIVYDALLRKKRTKILKTLWALMQKKDPHTFETIYFAIFILLHEISATSKDRFRWSRENGITARYDMEQSMEELHEGANIILALWTYYRRGLCPDVEDWHSIRNSPPKAKIQLQYVSDDVQKLMIALCTASEGEIESKTERPASQTTSRYARKRKEVRPEADLPFIWERDMHFTSQMFQANWHAQKQWQRSDG
ncbi:hypothetical protein PG993_010848 [Apiospora rasikravindrae]|uniref:Zn(2)-C6 fungal-type domain-containing protein n=1 Tax=Apiospora rasikravindrae TaxID=990691 RepID=A0ABR1SCJ4_9PEZI